MKDFLFDKSISSTHAVDLQIYTSKLKDICWHLKDVQV
jgi:hypothetical protein